jgi:hypothetical protein
MGSLWAICHNTTDDELLHLIFSRYGTVKSTCIIRDGYTEESSCNAFIEFETEEVCEQSYYGNKISEVDCYKIRLEYHTFMAYLLTWNENVNESEFHSDRMIPNTYTPFGNQTPDIQE